ncbi:MAG: hypothetical protein LCH68_01500 [Proteobacteria bacterium]|nr:hypothetical protein [Pseudomonadota bacterium]
MTPSFFRRAVAPTLFLAAAVAGSLDLLYAFAFWGAQGLPPVRILQSIASGWLGREAYSVGAPAAVLGALSHYGIVLVMAWTCYRVARIWPALARRPWLFGPLYGAALYLAMTYVVVPLSAAGNGQWPAWQWNQLAHLAAHMALVGTPCAFAAARVLRGPASG